MVSDKRAKRIREKRNRESAILLAVFLTFDTAVVAAAVSEKPAAETQQEAAVRCESAAEELQAEVSGENPETETVCTTAQRPEAVGGIEPQKAVSGYTTAENGGSYEDGTTDEFTETEKENVKNEAINSKTEAETVKTEAETVKTEADTVTETDQDRSLPGVPEGTSDTGAETKREIQAESAHESSAQATGSDAGTLSSAAYACTVDGHTCAYAEYLYNALDRYGRADWFRYALCQCYQESRFDPQAVSADGKDKGLFQFREEYFQEVYAAPAGFAGADIFDPYAQIEIYAYWVNERLAASADLYTTISDHYTGGYGYNAEYVHQVLQWLPTVEKAGF